MVNLYFLQYNNYFNRQTKPHRTITNWFLPYQIGNTVGVQLFNYGDGVDTTQVVNTTGWVNENRVPDYCVVENQTDGSRQYWYVVEWKYLRKGQYEATLKRDVLSENYDLIITAPMLIKKGTVYEGDSAIFNSEGQAYNQIKSSETLLYDETGCPWVVGYVPRNSFNSAEEAKRTVTQSIYTETDFTYATLEAFRADYPYDFNMSGRHPIVEYNNDPIYSVRAQHPATKRVYNSSFTSKGIKDYNPGAEWVDSLSKYSFMKYSLGYYQSNSEHTFGTATWTNKISGSTQKIYDYMKINLNDMDNAMAALYKVYSDFLTLLQNKLGGGKMLRVGSAEGGYTYYRIEVSKVTKNVEHLAPQSIVNYYSTNLPSVGILSNTASADNYVVTMDYNDWGYTLVETTGQEIKAILPQPNKRNTLGSNPYDTFAIPYGNIDIYKDGIKELTTNKYAATGIATAISEVLGDANVYDIQLLPYCPLRGLISEDDTIDYHAAETKLYTNIVNSNGEVINKIFWCTDDSFSFQIPLSLKVENYKIENECDMYRLCSPNYTGVFEFNLAKNGGLDYIEVDCTYKPFNPYIKLNPNFKRLYGSDFNDQRGLICGGDFSLPQLSNAWANFQLNNKNYQLTFDREIQSMEISNRYQRISEWMNLLSGTAKAGMAIGSLSNPVTGGISAGINLATGVASNIMSDKLRDEQVNLKKDLFYYQLDNVKAIPSALSKASSFNINNKYVPFLEKYTCTEEEKNALRDKLRWQGMTVMRTGQIQDYVWADDTYIEAMPLRLTGLGEDTHTAQAIAQELNMGTYIFISEDTE